MPNRTGNADREPEPPTIEPRPGWAWVVDESYPVPAPTQYVTLTYDPVGRIIRTVDDCEPEPTPEPATNRYGQTIRPTDHRCARCAEQTPDYLMWMARDDDGNRIRVCTECEQTHYDQCGNCSLLVTPGTLREVASGGEVCRWCLASNYWLCGNCDEYSHDDEHCYNGCDRPDEDDDDYNECDCYQCRHNRADGGGYINGYGYKPRPVFHGEGPLFLGLELEMETERRSRSAKIAVESLGNLGYLKSDSSINCGFELVTHPMSYQYAMDSFPWPVLDALKESGAEAESSCGLHVHISRDGFSSPCHAYRWLKFLYRNERHVKAIARRESNSWAAFHEYDRQEAKTLCKRGYGNDRYSAVNCQNRDTYEMRVFASSLNQREVKAALGLAAASVEYTRTLSAHKIINDGGWTWEAFTRWVGEQPEYRPLYEEMNELVPA